MAGKNDPCYRARLHSQGLRPIHIWIPDVNAPGFGAERTGNPVLSRLVKNPNQYRHSSTRYRRGLRIEADETWT